MTYCYHDLNLNGVKSWDSVSGYLMHQIWRYTTLMVLGSLLRDHMSTSYHQLIGARAFRSELIAQLMEIRTVA
jgi:hypothetical protein